MAVYYKAANMDTFIIIFRFCLSILGSYYFLFYAIFCPFSSLPP